MLTVTEAVRSRRSVRAFLPDPVPLATLERVFEAARWAPSGCNYQPWEGTVLTGAPLDALQDKMRGAPPQDPPEYDWSAPGKHDAYAARLNAVSAAMYGAQGIVREDKAARWAFIGQNLVSFGAPALLLVHFPRFMGPPQWSDVGMWLQTIMLLLREEGLDSCPQEYLWMHARLIKEHIGIDDATHIFFCGLAIGRRDPDAPVNGFERERLPVEEHVRFVGWE